jgi:hypothetical protein
MRPPDKLLNMPILIGVCGARRKLRSRKLIEQRLELMVVMLVEKCDTHLSTACQHLRATDSGKTSTDNDYVL